LKQREKIRARVTYATKFSPGYFVTQGATGYAALDQNATTQIETSNGDRTDSHTGSTGQDEQFSYSIISESAFPSWDGFTQLTPRTNSGNYDLPSCPTYEHIGAETDHDEQLFGYLAS
jgi:hypothetical protein